MSTQVILLQRVDNLGAMGDVVSVKPGYARNYLLPQKKALRASKENIAHFEAQKASLKKLSDEKKSASEKIAQKMGSLKVALIRQASEAGQLFGSVTARDIADVISAASGEKIDRTMIVLNQNYKMLGLFPVAVALHPEVKVNVTINIARSEDEAKIQAKTGKALVAESGNAPKVAEAVDSKSALLEDSALKAEAEEEAHNAETEAKKADKAKSKAEKKASKKTEDVPAEDAGE
jgi:large subunit ribosomal protein L9